MLDLSTCPCSGATLDRLIQPAVLAVLAEGPLHGYKLGERIGRLPMFAGRRPDVSGIYRFLKGMERRGFVTSSWDVSDHGPAKKRYALTKAGQRCLARWVETLDEFRRGIDVLLTVARKSMSGGRAPRTSRSARTTSLVRTKQA